ncbi:PREDICTED: protein FAM184A-like, partial [Apaloderma vittatum]|uniref:protein FAM184A-like n=1 Tax=Apaloderma vittatum TaxID=57397 RepID=UPI00052164B9
MKNGTHILLKSQTVPACLGRLVKRSPSPTLCLSIALEGSCIFLSPCYRGGHGVLLSWVLNVERNGVRAPAALRGAERGAAATFLFPSLALMSKASIDMRKRLYNSRSYKVIYALNTKNDEHEAAIQALKDAHEEEIQQILAETREKILQYKSKVAEEMDLKRKIQVLEESLEDHKKMKHQALTEFEAYKDRVEDMQLCAEAQHVQRVVTMSREVEEIRKKFEERLRSFIQLQVQYEKDKRTALEDLRAAHRLEIQELLKTQQSQNATLSKGQEKLEELHRLELEDLNNKVEELRLERKKLIEDYEGKLSKAQSFYEHELDSLKRSQLFTAESLHACKEKEVELRKEFQNQESILRKNLGKLKTELQMVQDEAASLREKCQKLQVALGTAENNVQVLQKQLDDVKEEEMSLLSKHKEVESELAAARERLQQQATDLVLKA